MKNSGVLTVEMVEAAAKKAAETSKVLPIKMLSPREYEIQAAKVARIVTAKKR